MEIMEIREGNGKGREEGPKDAKPSKPKASRSVKANDREMHLIS